MKNRKKFMILVKIKWKIYDFKSMIFQNLMIFRTFMARVRLRKHISTFVRPLGGEFCPGGQLKLSPDGIQKTIFLKKKIS